MSNLATFSSTNAVCCVFLPSGKVLNFATSAWEDPAADGSLTAAQLRPLTQVKPAGVLAWARCADIPDIAFTTPGANLGVLAADGTGAVVNSPGSLLQVISIVQDHQPQVIFSAQLQR